jgi:hypothetical protein
MTQQASIATKLVSVCIFSEGGKRAFVVMKMMLAE